MRKNPSLSHPCKRVSPLEANIDYTDQFFHSGKLRQQYSIFNINTVDYSFLRFIGADIS